MIVHVVLPIPVRHGFDFALAGEPVPERVIGRRVCVSFAGKEAWGIAVSARPDSGAEGASLEPILEIGNGPVYSQELLSFCQRLCEEYCSPLGLLLNRTLPRHAGHRPVPSRRLRLARDLGDVLQEIGHLARRAPRQSSILRDILATSGTVDERDLSGTASSGRASIDRLIERGFLQIVSDEESLPVLEWPQGFPREGRVLLRGEDRLEIYAALLSSTVQSGRQALVLVPETLLAHRLYQRLTRVPGLAGGHLYHSGLSDGARGNIWNDVGSKGASWVLGTRSAVFLPFADLALIIVDEEQDPSHKQSDMLPYFHARRAALVRSPDALVVLGSKTPSAESFYAAEAGHYETVTLPPSPQRTWSFIAPTAERDVLPPPVAAEIERALAAGHRVLIGIPRRGYFHAVLCRTCRRPLRCERCSTNLSVAQRGGRAICQTCGLSPTILRCSHCGSQDVGFLGWGSLRVEEAIHSLYPQATALRIDADRFTGSKPDGDLMEQLEKSADIVLGTPMIAKGPALQGVRLVIALDVDRRFALPDFRARERAFQYLSGLASLASSGRVIVVTTSQDRTAYDFLANDDIEGFLQAELEDRQALTYPPYCHVARLAVTRADRGRLRADIERLRSALDPFPIDILGPAPSPRDPQTARLLLKAADRSVLLAACDGLQGLGLSIAIDLDPERL